MLSLPCRVPSPRTVEKMLGPFLTELRKRRVYRVGASYALAAWIALQLAEATFEPLGVPAWAHRMVIVTLALGFPVALALGWAYDVTPGGIRRTRSAPRRAAPPRLQGPLRVGVAAAMLLLIGGAAGVAALRMIDARAVAAEYGASIAVLPFVNLSGDPEQEYFSDGITEELLSAIARVGSLRVPARTSSFSFKGENQPIGRIAEALGVEHILEGSVRRSGDRVRITAQLIDARADRNIWSQTYDRDMADVFAVQSEIAEAITRALLPRITGVGAGDPRAPTRSAVAHDLYLRGRFELSHRGDRLLEAARYFQEAIEEDPEYADAHAGLALASSLRYGWALEAGQRLDSLLPEVHASARRALSLDPSLSEPHTALGFILSLPDAEREFRQAIEKNPNDATALHQLATLLAVQGRDEEALPLADRSVSADPLTPIHRWARGRVHLYARRYSEAEADFEAVLRMSPESWAAARMLGVTRVHSGRIDEGVAPYYEGTRQSFGDALSLAEMDTVLRAFGNLDLRPTASRIVQRADGSGRLPAIWSAYFWANLGEPALALHRLEAASALDLPLALGLYNAELAVLAGWDPLRGEPRFQAILARLGLPNRGPGAP
jgi:adenylate cyclase